MASADTSKSPPKLTDLPTDLCITIAKFVAADAVPVQLRNLRFHRKFSEVARKQQFQSIIFGPTHFEVNCRLLADRSITCLVKEVIFDNALFDEAAVQDVDFWSLRLARRHPGMLRQFPDVRSRFREYGQRYTRQQDILAGNRYIPQIGALFRECTNLRKITFSAIPHQSHGEAKQMYRNLPRGFNNCKPKGKAVGVVFAEKHQAFGVFLAQVSRLSSHKITTIVADSTTQEEWPMSSLTLAHFSVNVQVTNLFSNLTALDLKLRYAIIAGGISFPSSTQHIEVIGRALRSHPHLQRLRICFLDWSHNTDLHTHLMPDPGASGFKNLGLDSTLPSLKRIFLGGITVTEKDMTDFFDRHEKVASMEFEGCGMLWDSWQAVIDHVVAAQHRAFRVYALYKVFNAHTALEVPYANLEVTDQCNLRYNGHLGRRLGHRIWVKDN